MKLKPETLVFSFRSGDDYIKRAFLRRGYHENSVKSSNLYDIKWEYTDAQTDYNTLRQGQFYNHFPGNREITTKSGLNALMRNSVAAGYFAPRSYDLQDQKQIDEFAQDYERTAKFSVIKSHAHYFMKIHGNLLRKMEKVFGSLYRGINYKLWKEKIKTKMA